MKKALLFITLMCSVAVSRAAYEDTNFSKFKYAIYHPRYYNAENTFYEAPLVYTITDKGEVAVSGADMKLKNISIPNVVKHEGRSYKVTSIHGYAFQRCYNLEELTIPANLNYMYTSTLEEKTVYQSGPFFACRNLKVINAEAAQSPAFWNKDAQKRNLLKDIAQGRQINTPEGSDYTLWAPYVNGLALNITMNAKGWATYFLNKTVKIEEKQEATVYILKEQGGQVNFESLQGVYIPAGTAVLIKAQPGANVVLRTTEIANGEKTDDVTGNLLQGTLEDVTAKTNGEFYVLSETQTEGGTEWAAFRPVQSGEMLAGHEAFLPKTIALSAQAKAILSGETTGIKAVKNQADTKATYDLQGRKTNRPEKGIYIQNGKKAYKK